MAGHAPASSSATEIIDSGVEGTMIDLIRGWDALKPGLEAKAAAGGGVPLARP
jgi:hypothetical protein